MIKLFSTPRLVANPGEQTKQPESFFVPWFEPFHKHIKQAVGDQIKYVHFFDFLLVSLMLVPILEQLFNISTRK